jgi:hypothetical protein
MAVSTGPFQRSVDARRRLIQESVREMSAEERAFVAALLRPTRGGYRPYSIRPIALAAVGCVVFAVLSRVAADPRLRDAEGWLPRILGMAAIASCWYAVSSLPRYLRVRKVNTNLYTHMDARLRRVLEDGRVRVRRVSAVAVVAIEPVGDEGFGCLFDLGDGRVLFLKNGHLPYLGDGDEDEPWPCTEFELVERVADRGFVKLSCTGSALRPVRVVGTDEYDTDEFWDDRDEVLKMSLDEAVRTIVRAS